MIINKDKASKWNEDYKVEDVKIYLSNVIYKVLLIIRKMGILPIL